MPHRRSRLLFAVAPVAFTAALVAAAPPEEPRPGAPPAAPPGAAPAPPDAAPPPDPQPEPPEEAQVPAAAPAAHGATAGEALAFFMASRDYRTIRDLKSVMTASLKASYDTDPTPYNGRKGIRLSAFDYREPAPAPAAKSAAVTVKSLWEDQGEAVEVRSETVRLALGEDGLWKVSAVQRAGVQPVRFKESVAGVTSLRQVLRAWVRRDFETARGLMSDAFLKRQAGREEGIEAVFAGDPQTRRAAFRIVEMKPQGTASVTARVRLVETPPGRPSALEGIPRTLVLVRRGQRWILDDWR